LPVDEIAGFDPSTEDQDALLAVIRREALTAHEAAGVVDLLQRAPRAQLQQYILDTPREAFAARQRRCLAVMGPAAERARQ
jgi:hypothetical protein